MTIGIKTPVYMIAHAAQYAGFCQIRSHISSLQQLKWWYGNISTPQASDLNLKEQTLLSDKAILQHWELLTGSVPHKYSVELLKAIAKLWIHVRGHSFGL